MKLSEFRKEKLLSEVQFSASRSSGPGGQNVNKVSTKIELRFNIENSGELTINEKQLLILKLKNRINNDGQLVLTSSSGRSQLKNREMAEKKFYDLIEKALTIQKKRKKTMPTAASRLLRTENKRKLSQKKSLRKPPET